MGGGGGLAALGCCCCDLPIDSTTADGAGLIGSVSLDGWTGPSSDTSGSADGLMSGVEAREGARLVSREVVSATEAAVLLEGPAATAPAAGFFFIIGLNFFASLP